MIRFPPGRVTAWLLLAWIVAVLGFVVMAGFASADDRFAGDRWVTEKVQDVHGEAIAKTLDYTADFGDLPLVVVAAALAGAVAARFASWVDGALIVGSLASRGVNSVVKEIVGRPRPSGSLVHISTSQPTSPSFPSGHSDTVFVLFGFIFYLAAVYIKDIRLRLAVQAVSLWVIIFTGIQRVHVGDHWPSDVLGGYYLGALMLAGLIALEWLVRSRVRGVS